MSTTAVIVEILIIGIFTAIWVFFLCLRLSLFDLQSFKDFASSSGNWATPLTFIAGAVFYYLGLIMNILGFRITKKYSEKLFEGQNVTGKDYDYVRLTVYHKGSEELVSDLKFYLTIVRLARAGIINFLLIAIVMFSFGGIIAIAGILSLLFSVSCLYLWRTMSDTYYSRIRVAYKIITENNAQSNCSSG